jgi:hypothetical protein
MQFGPLMPSDLAEAINFILDGCTVKPLPSFLVPFLEL